MSAGKKILVMVVLVVLITGAFGYLVLMTMYEQNETTKVQLADLQKKIADLKPQLAQEAELDRTIAGLQQQMESMKQIVPEEKEVDQFIHLIQGRAADSGVIIRRFTAKPVVTREFYSEVPFELELDGRYYQVLEFFQSIAKETRIVNVSNLAMASTRGKGGGLKLKRRYNYSPEETVVALCQAITFFSHDSAAQPEPAKGKPPARGARR